MPMGTPTLPPGVTMRFVHCSGEAAVAETRLERGAVVPRHRHDSLQVSVVLRGRLLLGVEGGGEEALGPGDYRVIPPGAWHWARALEDTVVLDINTPLTSDRKRLAEALGHECG
ncbi:MAG: cupin domain-containing protein [Desulfurococcales archaeon]|nr:cupin domain-containing protein [Desulfurococcales archaeon]